MTVFWLDRAEALRRLSQAASRLVEERPDVRAVYLFGSLTEGRAVPGSDADILILLESSDRRWLDRPLEFYPYFEGVGLPVDLFCYTVAEVEQVALARHALARGLLLVGRSEPPASEPPRMVRSSAAGGLGPPDQAKGDESNAETQESQEPNPEPV